jgi:lipopolysaccharide transport system ATP-binding protein
VIEFDHVSKSYSIYQSPGDRLKELVTFNRRQFHKDFWALHDVSFRVERGETFCIVGENGSGKSTALELIAGILQPTEGTVTVTGRVSALLELGAGFNPEFSGRDNVYLNGSILGLSTRQLDERYRDIEAFAEIGDFINRPVKTYSSGMSVRLAFAVAIHVDPEVLLVDEALAVGDMYFRQRCLRKVHELRRRGVTIVFVSHSAADVKALGDRTLWLDQGRMVEIGATARVIERYLAAMVEKDSKYLAHKHSGRVPDRERVEAPEVVDEIPNIDHRFGDQRAEILGIAALDTSGRKLQLLEPLGRMVVRISVRARAEVERPIVGFMMRNHLGVDFSGTNTAREGCELAPMVPGDVYTVDFHLEMPELYPGTFSLSPAIADGTLDGYHMCDWIDNALALQMSYGDGQVYGFLRLPCQVTVNTALHAGTPAPQPAAGIK